MKRCWVLLLSVIALSGCGTSYTWRSQVPERVRTVCVPTFRNGSDVTELGSIMTRELLREFQREGTFKISRSDDAALEVQGEILSAVTAGSGYDRRGARITSSRLVANVSISVIDKVSGTVIVNNKNYRAEACYEINQDTLTGQRNASGRLSEDLARQVVDDMLRYPYDKKEEGK